MQQTCEQPAVMPAAKAGVRGRAGVHDRWVRVLGTCGTASAQAAD